MKYLIKNVKRSYGVFSVTCLILEILFRTLLLDRALGPKPRYEAPGDPRVENRRIKHEDLHQVTEAVPLTIA